MKQIFFILVLIFLLTGCGAKKNVAKQNEKIALQGQGLLVAANSETGKPTLGLLWQNDHLQITLNQGRQLESYRAETDTLYLYETVRDTADHSIRKYTLSIPTRELLIIKYNDSLVYPIMPSAEKCEYPLEIKVMGAKNLNDYYEKKRRDEEESKKRNARFGVVNASIFPLELRAGTYFYNAGLYELGVDCDCVIDSTKTFALYLDGSWQQYENGILKDCGIMRKKGFPLTYVMENYKRHTVLFSDTTSIAGHIISLREDKRRWKEKIPYAPNEYFYCGRTRSGASFEYFELYSCKTTDAFSYFYGIDDDGFRLEGSTCGWLRINK